MFKDSEGRVQAILENSFLSDILTDEGVTDIRYNGTDLWLQHNQKPYRKAEKQPSIEDVQRLIKQIADAQRKEITDSNPILDTEIGYLRVNAIHESVSPDGMTFAIRVSRPRLAMQNVQSLLTKNTIPISAGSTDDAKKNNDLEDEPVEGLLKLLMQAGSNIVISGRTGTGKTELQKLLVGFVPDDQKISLIEDTRDSHIKALYPQKDIMSWQTLLSDDREKKITMQDLVKAGLRNNPDWLIISETRGQEASDMLDSAKTDHSVITTVHAKGAMNIPARLIPMIKQSSAYQTIDEKIIGKEITELIRFGIHLELEFINNQAVRRIKEIVEYTDYGKTGAMGTYLYQYQQEYDARKNQYRPKEVFNPLSKETISVLKDKRLYHLLPSVFSEEKRKSNPKVQKESVQSNESKKITAVKPFGRGFEKS